MADGVFLTSRPLPADRTAAERLGCEWITTHPDEMRSVARGASAPMYQVTGPALDAIASILLRGNDPAQHVGLIVDAVARELRPRGACVDPQTLESHGGSLHVMDIYTSGLYDAPAVTRELGDDPDSPATDQPSKVAAANVLRMFDRGQNHRDRNHRAKEKQARAREAGQQWFTGFSWRVPDESGAANDEADPDGEMRERSGRKPV